MKPEFFWADFRKVLLCQISWKWEPSCCMRTDGQRHDEANSLFSKFLPTRLKMEMKIMLIRPFSTKKLKVGLTVILYSPVVAIRTTSLTFNNSTYCPHSVFMCFVRIWEQTAIISLYSIDWLVCIAETESVYCAVRTGSLCITQVNRNLQNVLQFILSSWMQNILNLGNNGKPIFQLKGFCEIIKIFFAPFCFTLQIVTEPRN